MTKTFKSIGIVGSWTMGAGIAQVMAMAGYRTLLYDLNTDVLDQAMARLKQSIETGMQKGKLPENAWQLVEAQLSTTPEMAELGCGVDLVIEAVPEDLALKKTVFETLDNLCPPETCFATNTSSLSVTVLAAATKRPAQVAGMHFFNPVPQMKLVEVIYGKETRTDLVEALCDLTRALGKTSVKAKDTPGFIVNRVARSYYGEALRLLDEGVADIATLDAIMRDEGGFPMGPFALMDLIGIDVNYAVSQSVYHAYGEEARFQPHPIQRQMVEAGYLGRKTKRGFYVYD